MQNRYVGDIGDYVKFAILRGLSPGKRLGIAWWLLPDGGPAGDGRHISYLQAPDKWRLFDATVFDALARIVASGRRDIRALEDADLVRGVTFFSEPVAGGTQAQRQDWFERCRTCLSDCDLVFVDPDNGLETSRFRAGARAAGKAVALAELSALQSSGRTLIVYHHHTRRAGGHIAELDNWGARLRALGFDPVDALRASPFSPRAFFLLDPDAKTRERAADLSRRWNGVISWHADCGRAG